MINFQKKVAILEVLCIRGLSELGGVSLRGHLSKGGVCFRGIYSKRSQSASEGGLLMGKYTSMKGCMPKGFTHYNLSAHN